MFKSVPNTVSWNAKETEFRVLSCDGSGQLDIVNWWRTGSPVSSLGPSQAPAPVSQWAERSGQGYRHETCEIVRSWRGRYRVHCRRLVANSCNICFSTFALDFTTSLYIHWKTASSSKRQFIFHLVLQQWGKFWNNSHKSQIGECWVRHCNEVELSLIVCWHSGSDSAQLSLTVWCFIHLCLAPRIWKVLSPIRISFCEQNFESCDADLLYLKTKKTDQCFRETCRAFDVYKY